MVKWWSTGWRARCSVTLSIPIRAHCSTRFRVARLRGSMRRRWYNSNTAAVQPHLLRSRHLPRVAASIDQQHQRRELAQNTVANNRHRLGERQRQFVFRHAADGFCEFIAERDRQRHGAAVAAGPAIGIGAELVDARQKVRGHADIAVPDIIERDLADLRPQPLQPLGDARLDPLDLVARTAPASPRVQSSAPATLKIRRYRRWSPSPARGRKFRPWPS